MIYTEVLEKIKEHVSDRPLVRPQICELANLRKWYVPEWLKIQKDLKEPDYFPPNFVHRKTWEWVQCIYGLRKLGILDDNNKIHEDLTCLGIGTGHEPLIYYFSNLVGEHGHVIATDLYDINSEWILGIGQYTGQGNPDILINLDKYAPFPYRKDKIEVLRMNGYDLKFPDNTFDFVWSCCAIEHFGSHENSAKAMREIGRVLKPGGIAMVTVEYLMETGFPGFKGYSPDHTFFNLEDLYRYIIAFGQNNDNKLKLVQDIDFTVDEYCLRNNIKFPDEIGSPYTVKKPHMILRTNEIFFTNIALFFRKE